MEGFAEVRTVHDFPAFARLAGHPGLDLPRPAYPGAHAATQNLLHQVSGPAKDRLAFIDEAAHGPAVMHFDQLADGVVRNRLAEVVPYKAEDRQAVRAALIATMLHRGWPTLKNMSASTGEAVAEDIRRSLNAKVDEIRQHYQAKPHQVFPADVPNQDTVRLAVESQPHSSLQATQSAKPDEPDKEQVANMRFLAGQAPAAYATRSGPPLGDGARGVGTTSGPTRPVRQTGSARQSGPDRASD
jgi:hypothetical protein